MSVKKKIPLKRFAEWYLALCTAPSPALSDLPVTSCRNLPNSLTPGLTSHPGRQLPILIEKWLLNISAPAPRKSSLLCPQPYRKSHCFSSARTQPLCFKSLPQVAMVGSETAHGGMDIVKNPWPWGSERCIEKHLCQRRDGGGKPGQQTGKKPNTHYSQFRIRSEVVGACQTM